MKCFNCGTEMFLGDGGNWNCLKCNIIINLLNLSRIKQEEVIANSYKCKPHDWEIKPGIGGTCNNCGDEWQYDR